MQKKDVGRMRYRRVLSFFSPWIELLSHWMTFYMYHLEFGRAGEYVYKTEKVVAGDHVGQPTSRGVFWGFRLGQRELWVAFSDNVERNT